jgi:hypothetical protein
LKLKSELRDLFKLLGVGLLVSALVCVVLAFIVIAFLFPYKSPPKEAEVFQNFHAHRAAYERLRNMLLEDKGLVRVASWGVETTSTIGTRKPPAGNFPLDRYNAYLALLNETGAVGAFSDRQDPPESVGVLVYASGWAGDTRHVDICWMDREPPNLVTSLDKFYKTPKPRKPVYRHVEDNWYLWADW